LSGGKFNYDQYKIGYIAESIEQEIRSSGKPKTREELKEERWRDAEWYEKYPEELYHYKYSDEVIEKFKEAVRCLKMAQIYAHRVDYLLSGDDGEESFLERLDEELKKI
jgi:hypothetical protein